jgi:carbon monoxide dehydrogenase subunit G
MEHEVLVPLAPQTVRRSLRRPELLARCLPGFVPAEEADPEGAVLTGRLKLRVGNSSITYRGTLRIAPEAGADVDTEADTEAEADAGADGVGAVLFAVQAEQAVGDGEAVGAVRITVLPLDGGEGDERSRMLFDCDLAGKGRIEELDPAALELAARRLLDRFCATFVVELDLEVPPEQQLFEELDGLPDLGDLGEFPDLADLSDLTELPDIDAPDLFMVEEPLVNPGPQGPDQNWTDEPVHRRSMVGRSAEEVDHAPPRGRYGPALPPRSARSRAAARWGSPERRMGEPPGTEAEYSRVPWLVGGGVAVVGGVVLIARALRRR